MFRRLVVIVSLSVFFLLNTESSQAQTFYFGSHVASASMGFMGTYGSYAITTTTPAMGISYEYGLTDFNSGAALGVGFYLGHKSFNWHHDFGPDSFEEANWGYTLFGLTSAYHFMTNSRFDPYVQVTLGSGFLNYTYIQNNYPNGTPPSTTYPKFKFMPGFSAGSRYFFSNNIAVFVEGGYGVAYVTGGLALKVF